MLHQRQAVHLHQQVCHPALQQTKWHHLMKLMRTETSVFLSALPLTIPTSLAYWTSDGYYQPLPPPSEFLTYRFARQVSSSRTDSLADRAYGPSPGQVH